MEMCLTSRLPDFKLQTMKCSTKQLLTSFHCESGRHAETLGACGQGVSWKHWVGTDTVQQLRNDAERFALLEFRLLICAAKLMAISPCLLLNIHTSPPVSQ